MYVVHYLLDGYFHCTRHTADCGTLARVRRQLDAGGDPRFVGLAIFEDARYSLPTRSRLRDHTCVQKFKEKEADPPCQTTTTPPPPLQPTLELELSPATT